MELHEKCHKNETSPLGSSICDSLKGRFDDWLGLNKTLDIVEFIQRLSFSFEWLGWIYIIIAFQYRP